MTFHQRVAIWACAALMLLPGAVPAQKAPNPVVVMETNVGTITMELFQDLAPKTVENFLTYARAGFYNGTIFHRIIEGFMIQGGGFTPQMRLKPTRPPIKNEASMMLRNERGTVAAARSGGVNTITAQFFINTADNVSLDHKGIFPDDFGYAVFGRVIEGMDVVDKIEHIKTDDNDKPRALIMIMRVSLKDQQ
jgi:cyclophilin family peptidyl-prolyl cis-trans isomerase